MEPSEGHIKRVVVNRLDRCRICHRPYRADDVNIISRQDEMWMMSVECTDCHARNFVAAVLNEGDPARAEVALRRLTELNEQLQPIASIDEIEIAVDPGQPVEATDVLDMHEFLEAFEGDFLAMFRGAK
jgi:C4-type Zn-finger protein